MQSFSSCKKNIFDCNSNNILWFSWVTTCKGHTDCRMWFSYWTYVNIKRQKKQWASGQLVMLARLK